MNLAIVTPEDEARDRARDAVNDAKGLPWFRADERTAAVVDGNRTDFYDTEKQERLFPFPRAIESDEEAAMLLDVFAWGVSYGENNNG